MCSNDPCLWALGHGVAPWRQGPRVVCWCCGVVVWAEVGVVTAGSGAVQVRWRPNWAKYFSHFELKSHIYYHKAPRLLPSHSRAWRVRHWWTWLLRIIVVKYLFIALIRFNTYIPSGPFWVKSWICTETDVNLRTHLLFSDNYFITNSITLWVVV